jgi:hypothetical protein
LIMKVLKLLILILFFGKQLSAQDSINSNNYYRRLKPNALNINYLGVSPLVGISYERLIKRKFCIEAGVGLFGVGMGLTYLPPKLRIKCFFPYFGLKQARFAAPTAFDSYVLYLPLGLNLISESYFQCSLDIGPSYWREYSVPKSIQDYKPHSFTVFGNLKFGYRFGWYKDSFARCRY